MGDEPPRVDVVAGEQPQQRRRGVRVDQAGRDGDVLDPQLLEVQRGGLAVHADVGDVATGPGQLDGQLEGGGHADRFDGHVGAQPAGQLADHFQRVLAAVVHRDIRAELLRRLQPGVSQVDRDDVARAEQAGAHDRGQADGAGADDRDHVTRLHLAVEDADLVAGRQDVGQHQDVLVGGAVRHRVGGGVGERHPDVLGLGAVDLVAEDPAAAAEALPVAALAAEPARAARGDAGDEHAVADLDRLHAGADRLDGPDRFVAEDPPVGHGRNVALEDVQIRAADRRGVDAHDRVRVGGDLRLRHVLPGLLPGPW